MPFPSPMHESEKWKWSHSVVSDCSDPMDCSLPGSSVHGIFQAKVLEWGAIAFSYSVAQSCPTVCDSINCSIPGFPVLHYLPEFAQTRVHWVGDAVNHLILCCLPLLLPSVFPSIRSFPMSRLFASGGQSIGSFSFSINTSNEYSWLISLRIDWFDLLPVQGTLESLRG